MNVHDTSPIENRGEWITYDKNHKKEAQIHRQVKQVSYKFQVESVDNLFLPLSFHKHVTDIEDHILRIKVDTVVVGVSCIWDKKKIANIIAKRNTPSD